MLIKCFLLFLVAKTSRQETNFEERDANALYQELSAADDPKIYYMSISTNVINRFATTLITCRIKNPSVVSKEATFSVILPDKAFISNFVMEINNVTYQSYVKEKQEAQQIYDAAVAKGESAGQVKVSARNSKRFSVNVNLEAEEKGVFYLTYEELLVRSRGKYDVVLNVYPGQPVNNLRMEVKINETQPLKFVNSPVLKPSGRLDAKEIMPRVNLENFTKYVYVRYNPDVSEQRRVARSLETGINNGLAAQFVVQYDVDRRSPGGQVIQTKNHFAQYYAPDKIPVLPKYVIFILDSSFSMMGQKMDQLKEALKNILLKLRPEDYFNIINFSYDVKVWDVIKGDVVPNLPTAHYATEQNVKRAIQIVDLLEPFGLTNIFLALKVGFDLLEKNYRQINGSQPIVMFLTDGRSNVGHAKISAKDIIEKITIVNTHKDSLSLGEEADKLSSKNQGHTTHTNEDIIEKITTVNTHKAGIYSLSLGEEADKDFLNKLSSKNQGHTTHIYEDSDISLQIEKFFETFSSPSLKNITFNFGSNITQVTQTQFATAFKGSELIVVGEKPEGTDLSKFQKLSISGDTRTGPVELKPDVETTTDNMERLWAYAEVKQLLAQRKLVEDRAAITKKALNLALKFSFVTEVTSLVVVKPKDENVINPVDADLGGDFGEFGATSSTTVPFYPSLALATTEFITSTPPEIEKKSATNEETDVDVTEKNYRIRTKFQNIRFIKEQIPWLNTLLFSNGTILRNPGWINLDASSDYYQFKSCNYTDIGMTIHGNCTKLHDCPSMFKELTNYSKLEKILCPLNEKWGICCTST